MSKSALIIFVRTPEWGKVKTRLARTIGNDKALLIYTELLNHTHAITKDLDCDKYIFYADSIREDDLWENDHYRKMLQQDGHLGTRMHYAFESVFSMGCDHIVIIGSDCFEMRTHHITDAFASLNKEPVVIGPAWDGGYYLLGLNKMVPEIFENISWSTPDVIKQTFDILKRLHHSYILLPAMRDVDEEGDLSADLRALAGLPEKD